MVAIGKAKDISGLVFNRLTVIARVGTSPSRAALWLCSCECGKDTIAPTNLLVNGGKKSCGCLHAEANKYHAVIDNRTHEKLYQVWNKMKDRCQNRKAKDFRFYGAKGITVCQEWLTYPAFREWAHSNGYREGLTIDRIYSHKGYCPENCRFITLAENISRAGKKFNERTEQSIELLSRAKIPRKLIQEWLRVSDSTIDRALRKVRAA